jgi:hypothetical protein
MKVVIRFTAKQEAKGMPFLFRHSPGMILQDRTYIVTEAAASLLRSKGIKFTEISREGDASSAGGELTGLVP